MYRPKHHIVLSSTNIGGGCRVPMSLSNFSVAVMSHLKASRNNFVMRSLHYFVFNTEVHYINSGGCSSARIMTLCFLHVKISSSIIYGNLLLFSVSCMKESVFPFIANLVLPDVLRYECDKCEKYHSNGK